MLILLGAVIGFLAGLATGGSLDSLLQIRLRWPVLVIAALVVKELGVFGPIAHAWFAPWLYALSLLGLIAWTLWHRDQLRMIWLVSLGMAMNLLVVTVNGGHMPVAPELAIRAGLDLHNGPIGQYIIASSETHLNWLGDWITMPGPLYRVFNQAYSLGDLVAFAGMTLVLFLATRPRLRQSSEQAARVR
jgi:uncharacterized protein DUF5317